MYIKPSSKSAITHSTLSVFYRGRSRTVIDVNSAVLIDVTDRKQSAADIKSVSIVWVLGFNKIKMNYLNDLSLDVHINHIHYTDDHCGMGLVGALAEPWSVVKPTIDTGGPLGKMTVAETAQNVIVKVGDADASQVRKIQALLRGSANYVGAQTTYEKVNKILASFRTDHYFDLDDGAGASWNFDTFTIHAMVTLAFVTAWEIKDLAG